MWTSDERATRDWRRTRDWRTAMNLRGRLFKLIVVRLVVSTLLLGSAILLQINNPGVFPITPLFALIGLTYGLTIVYLTTLRLVDRHRWLVDLQCGADVVLVSLFIHVTGGITSYFSSLYVLPVITASTVQFRRGALRVAALSVVLYFGVVAAQYVDVSLLPRSWQPEIPPALPTLRFAQLTVATNLFGFLAVAWLAGSLAEGVRTAGVRLKHASHEIADLRAFNELVIDSLPSGLATADGEGRLLTFNVGAGLITGMPRTPIAGRAAADILQLPPDFRDGLPTLDQTSSRRVEYGYRRADGRLIDLGLSVSWLPFASGGMGYLFTFQDITELKRLERSAQLQQRLAAVGEMAAGLAHEIRNPLASVSGSIQVLRQDLALSDEQAELMDIALRESDRLNDTIREFLAYARPQRFEVVRLDVANLVRQTAARLRDGGHAGEGHTIDLRVPEDPIWLQADEGQIRHLIWNLSTNGLRAMPDGGPLVLTADVEPGDQPALVLTVQDHGCGMTDTEVASLFQPFSPSSDRGPGLGLAIVYRTVRDYNGTIDVASTVGRGTAVRVTLPLGTAGGSPTAGNPADATRSVRQSARHDTEPEALAPRPVVEPGNGARDADRPEVTI